MCKVLSCNKICQEAKSAYTHFVWRVSNAMERVCLIQITFIYFPYDGTNMIDADNNFPAGARPLLELENLCLVICDEIWFVAKYQIIKYAAKSYFNLVCIIYIYIYTIRRNPPTNSTLEWIFTIKRWEFIADIFHCRMPDGIVCSRVLSYRYLPSVVPALEVSRQKYGGNHCNKSLLLKM